MSITFKSWKFVFTYRIQQIPRRIFFSKTETKQDTINIILGGLSEHLASVRFHLGFSSKLYPKAASGNS